MKLEYPFRPRGWNGSQNVPAPEIKQSGMRPAPASESMHRRRMPDYPPPHELKRRYSPGREPDMRARKKMRYGTRTIFYYYILIAQIFQLQYRVLVIQLILIFILSQIK